MSKKLGDQSILYQFDGKIPSIGQILPLGLQHVVAAIVGIITPAIMLANVVGFSAHDKTLLVQMALLTSALSTLLQIFGIKLLGAKCPIIIGTSFAYVPTLLAIGSQFSEYGIATVLGAQLVGSFVAIFFGLFSKQIRKFFPPIITGTVIFTIGLSLYSTAIKYMGGGVSSADFGSMKNWGIALFTLLVVVILNNFTKGIPKLASILLGMIMGYLLSLALGGMISFDSVQEAKWFQGVAPLHFGLNFKVSAIISMMFMYAVNSVQTIGDITSTTIGGMNREPTDKEVSGGIIGIGVTNFLASFLGGLPSATYSQNVGIVTVTKVINKFVFAFAAIVLLIAGLVPKFASLLTTIPQAVIGGATISVFASITMTGIRMIVSAKLTNRNLTIVGLAVAIGVGITSVPGCLQGFPPWVFTVFGSSSVVLSTLIAIILNIVLPKEKTELTEKAEN